jgi:hypothetical protein
MARNVARLMNLYIFIIFGTDAPEHWSAPFLETKHR